MPPPPGPAGPLGPPAADWYHMPGPSHARATPLEVRMNSPKKMAIVFMASSVGRRVTRRSQLGAAEPRGDRLVIGIALGEEVHAGVRLALVARLGEQIGVVGVGEADHEAPRVVEVL